MKDKELNFKEIEVSLTLGGAGEVQVQGRGKLCSEGLDDTLVSNTVTHSRTFSLSEPMDLYTCVIEEHRDGDGVVLQELSRLSYTRGYISLSLQRIPRKRPKKKVLQGT